MSENVQVLNCPACGATLNPPIGQSIMQCPYCHNSLAIKVPASRSNDEDEDSDFVPPTPIGTPGFATRLLSFGSEGSKPGKFQFSEAIGVDQNGNIYVADYLYNHRIQIFDSAGKYLRLIDLDQKSPSGMAVAREGTVYIAEYEDIHRLDAQGKDTRLYKGDAFINGQITLGADGSLYASNEKAQIIRLSPSGRVNLIIKNVFTPTLLGDKTILLAVDGQGNIYAGIKETMKIMKYSPKGKLIGQFGGKADEDATETTPGYFSQLFALAADGYGRIYASNFVGVQVFDADFHYLNSFAEANTADEAYSVFGMTFDSQNNLYMITDAPEVIKLALQKP